MAGGKSRTDRSAAVVRAGKDRGWAGGLRSDVLIKVSDTWAGWDRRGRACEPLRRKGGIAGPNPHQLRLAPSQELKD